MLPLVVSAGIAAGAIGTPHQERFVRTIKPNAPKEEISDTVIYPKDGYKLFRKGDFGESNLPDSLLAGMQSDSLDAADTLPVLTARDTIFPPDSLKFSDPFRYKYYVALLDSATHVFVRDSLVKSVQDFLAAEDTLHALADSADRFKLDSLYYADSTLRAKAAFLAWYNSLSKEERKKYDKEQWMLSKKDRADSLQKAREESKALKDSIIEMTPRVLETFALPDSMFYKRIISWKLDQSFQQMKVEIPDTSFNHYYYDYAFRRKDVNASWLGVAGSPVQTYDFFKRRSESGIDSFTPQEAWSFSPGTLPMYNTKTPHTELAYWGTLFAKEAKESDNLHIFTTQNITPALNLTLFYDRWGGGGMLNREETTNKVAVAAVNYLGKKYMMHAGLIHNRVTRQENGGMRSESWIRDTTLDVREIPVNLLNAESEFQHNTIYLDQQLRIPFTFIEKLRAKKDSSYTFNADSLNRNLTTAFIGHSTEFTSYRRIYKDDITDDWGQAFYRGVNNYGTWNSCDSLTVTHLDNKVFIKLQPWSDEAVVSKINIGLGDRLRFYSLQNILPAMPSDRTTLNSLYLYGGAEGQYKQYFRWNAKADFTVAGYNAADFGIQADATVNLFPFRRAKTSPLSLTAHFETNLRGPDFYQNHMVTNHFFWNNDFNKVSTTRIEGKLSIPHWKLNASVGYALAGNHIYYDSLAVIRQADGVMNILSASLRKDFVIGGFLHLDNQILFQISSNQEVLPLPMLSANLRYYAQFIAARHPETRERILTMQIGANVFCNTPWYAPGWNPNVGVFYNQNRTKYTNGPYIDVFLNMQWKKACIFVKVENIGMGWPLDKADYFSANGYISTARTVKLGIFWPFYIQPGKPKSSGHGGGHSHGSDSGGGFGGGEGGGFSRLSGGFQQARQ